ncbi:hypothetical protein [Paenibacillus soyae]|uniref:GAF domain-containing protein n=1 Tax=Paenibacillus soyae TaxID=2969249 RepID=A0A9X2MNR1_9BACL|nr:hypothetical protein [Paenibacillus soyae]MCR2804056.1 hypothetical protein [Paenibacillus soyae]
MILKNEYPEIRLEAECLVSRTHSDFAAIALPSGSFGKMKWDIVIGSRSDRLERMKIKPGIGLGGMVLRHGMIYMVNHNQHPSMRKECPVMLAEKLESGMAFPLPLLSAESSCGVLLLGRRTDMYMEEDIAGVQLLLAEKLLKSRCFGRYDGTTIQ